MEPSGNCYSLRCKSCTKKCGVDTPPCCAALFSSPGRSFNELCLDDRKRDADLLKKRQLSAEAAENFVVHPSIPHNPMINAGAIMISSMLYRDLPLADRFDKIMEVCTPVY